MIDPCPDTIPDPNIAAQWGWIGLILGVLAFELILLHLHRRTLSQYVQHKPRWFRWLAELGVLVLGLHLFGLL